MVERYEDISESFPEELSTEALPYFLDWFVRNVVIVKITAYSDENAYTIFETMNDRGLNLSPTEMLKGYVLSRVSDTKQRTELNDLWKEQIIILHKYGETADLGFFQSWFRGKYAESIRPGKAGSEDKDFELIGSRFHNWFKDNHKKLFECLDEGNKLRKKMLNYDITDSENFQASVINLFEENQPLIRESSKKSSNIRPIFILGMPRSGTSLVEQIVSSHHAVHGAGELPLQEAVHALHLLLFP